jgi:glycosyltransferase involved in cell wall biosynthesis
MTKTLLITSMYPPHHYGGYELSCADVVERWRARGHDITVLTSDLTVDGVETPADERRQGIRRELEIYWRDHELLRPGIRARAGIETRNQRRVRGLLAEVQPEVVSVWHMGAMSLGLLSTLIDTGVPLVYVVCDDWLIYGPQLDRWAAPFRRHHLLARLATRLTGLPATLPDVGASGTFCFVSDDVRQHAEASSSWSFPDSTVVYSGIERRDFPARTASAPWRWRMLYVGRIDDRKGIDTVIEALPLLPEGAQLTVVGRGDRSHLRQLHMLAARLGVSDRVRFVDAVDRASLARYYHDADVVVFPPKWDEPFGLVPVEAMSCGVPVVATCTGGSAEFLGNGGNCLRFQAGDAGDLAGAVRRLADDEGLRARLVAAGFHTAAELDVDRLADVLEAWHEAAARRFATGRPADRRALDAGISR